jgi:hypothetical protein
MYEELGSRGPDPASLRHVEHDSIRASVFHLNVTFLPASAAHSERFVDVVARVRTRGYDVQAVDLETNVVNAVPIFAAFDAGNDIVLEIQNCQIDMTIAGIIAFGAMTVEFPDLLRTEAVQTRGP